VSGDRSARWTGVRLAAGLVALACIAATEVISIVVMADTYVVVGVPLAIIAMGLALRALVSSPDLLVAGLVVAAAPMAFTLVDHDGIRWSAAATGPLLLAAAELIAFSHDAWSVAPPGRRVVVGRLVEITVLVALATGISLAVVAAQRLHVRSSLALLVVGALAVLAVVWFGIDPERTGTRRRPTR